jgi:type II secretory pathway component PulM
MTLRQQLNHVRERLIILGRQSAAALQRARTQQVDLNDLKRHMSRLVAKLQQLLQQKPSLSMAQIRPWLHQHGRKLAITAGLPVLGLSLLLIIHQQINRLSGSLALKPAQFNAIESLVQESKSNSANPSIAPPLTDNDLETMRVILQNRGINTNILRLNLEQGVRIELQAEQVPFGQWIAFLEEIAKRWQIYPLQLTLQANEQPGSVSVRGTLQQTQATP